MIQNKSNPIQPAFKRKLAFAAVLQKPSISPSTSRMRMLCAMLAGLVCLGPLQTAMADDIDIYSLPPTFASAPNVMFLLDSTASWNRNNENWNSTDLYTKCLSNSTATDPAASCQSIVNDVFYPGVPAAILRPWQGGVAVTIKKGLVEIRILRRVINSVTCNGSANALKVNVGLSFLNGGSAIINSAVRALQGSPTDPTTTCGKINTELAKMDATFGGGNPYQTTNSADYGTPMFELFKYFGGYTNPDNAIKIPEVAGSPVSSSAYGTDRYSGANANEDMAAFTSALKTTYAPPIGSGGLCARNYVVIISNGAANLEPSGPGSFVGLNYTPPVLVGGSPTFADRWSYFLANTDVNSAGGFQPVFTYAIDVYNGTPNTGQVTQTALLKAMVKVGGVGPSGYYLANGDLNALVLAFSDILVNAAAVDSVFTATSLPVSTTSQGSFLNQLFVGMFRPDDKARPGWVGNLKQYQLAFDASRNVIVADVANKPAIDQASGFFRATATSIWTTTSKFFTNRPSGTPLSASDAPDGAVVDKGGAAQSLRKTYETQAQQDARKIYTINFSQTAQASAGFPTISTTAVGSNNTGSASVSLTSDEVSWLRGTSNVLIGNGAENFIGTSDAGLPVTVRPSIHGDILHSRPVALNYGKDANGLDNIGVFYGTNDGLLHAIDGRKSSTGGSEYWSFLAPESYDVVKRARNGNPEVLLPVNQPDGTLSTAPLGSTVEARRYGMDGPIGVFASYNATGTLQKGVVYTTMRRGGSAVYAFDVTSTPSGSAPALLWSVRGNNAGFSRLGQTWSMPKPTILSTTAYPGNNVVAVFGAGYNPDEDNPTTKITSSKGRAVYVVNAFSGAKILEITGSGADAITGSVVGDVTYVDSNLDGKFDRIYFSDTSGGVYRIDMVDGFANWTVKKIAQVPGKIFHAPDVVVTKEFVAVFVGTGDREKPLMTTSAEGMYLIKDTLMTQTNRTTVLSITDLKQISTVDNAGTIVAAVNTTTTTNGCYVSLATNGEKVVNTPLTVTGTTYFGTNKPTPAANNSCTGSLGEARTYRFPVFCGQITSSVVTSGGFPPSPVGGLVSIGNEIVPFVIGGGSGKSAFQAERPRPPIEPRRKKNFYRVVPAGSGNL